MTDPSTSSPDRASAQPAPAPLLERESDAQFLVGVLSLLLGAMFLLAALLLYASGGTGLASEGMPRFRIVAAIGAGLFALGAALEFPRFMDLIKQRKSLHAANAVLMSALAFVLLIIVNFLSARHDFWRADLTAEGLYTLSEESRALVSALDREVRLVVLSAAEQDREMAPLDALIDQYKDASTRIGVERKDLRRMSQSELQALIQELGLEGVRSEDELLGVAVLTGVQTAEGFKKDRSKHVPRAELWEQSFERGKRTFLGEQKLSSAIREVVEGKRAKLYFLTGHAEASIDDHGQEEGLGKLAAMLRQRNRELETLDLADGKPVPQDCDLLVIPGPRVTLAQHELQSIERYLDRGGDAIIMLDPVYGVAGERGTRFMPSGLEDVLRSKYGIAAADALVYLQFQDPIAGVVITETIQCDEYDLAHPVVKPLDRARAHVAFLGARPIKPFPAQGATTSELVKTGRFSPACFSTDDPIGTQRMKRPMGEMERAPFTLAVSSERTIQPSGGEAQTEPSKRSRVVVVGDTDWVENPLVGEYRFHNLELFLGAASWAMEREEQVVGKAARPRSYRLEMAPETLAAMKLFSLFGLPAVAIGLGLFAWMLRRR